jgi:hypothetical protein
MLLAEAHVNWGRWSGRKGRAESLVICEKIKSEIYNAMNLRPSSLPVSVRTTKLRIAIFGLARRTLDC